MQIDNDGTKLSSVSGILTSNLEAIRKTLGSDFSIKPEGAIDNIITAIGLMERDLQQQLAYAIKQFDPETAEDEYQDYLYERVMLYRIAATPTTFVIAVSGEPLATVDKESVLIQESESQDFFFNKSEFVFDENGIAEVEFCAVLEGTVDVSKNSEFILVTKPEKVVNIDCLTIKDIKIGTNRESDNDFRERFHNLKSANRKCSRNAILDNLSVHTGGLEFVSVLDCNSDDDIPAGAIQITARPIVSDAEFCKHILDNVIAGVVFIGNTTVDVPLSNGQTWEVSFQKAEEVNIDLYIKTKLRSAYYEKSVFNRVRNNILAYLEKHIKGLKSTIWATEFIVPTLEVDGIDAVTEILIKRHDSTAYSGSVSLALDEYPKFAYENINLTK